MFTKKLEDQFSADLLNTVKGILDEAKKCPKDCECEKCEKEEDEEDEDEMKEGFASAAQRKAVWATYADGGKTLYQKVTSEEVEELDELSRATVGRYAQKAKSIADNEGGKDRTKGRELAGRKRWGGTMSGVKKAKVMATEESEQIDELSKKTLGNYVKKAAGHAAGSAAATAAIASSSNPKVPGKVKRDLRNRLTGISKAADKLTKEEAGYLEPDLKKRKKNNDQAVKDMKKMGSPMKNPHFGEEAEQIDELSKATMGRYINKAAERMSTQGVTAGLKIAADEKSKKNFDNIKKREKGIAKAVSKLTKEDQDFIDSLNNEMWDEIAIAEGRGRPPKEGTPAWHARQKQANDDMVALGMQLRKAKSMNKKVRFMDGKEHEVSAHHADKFEDHMAARKTSQEKAAFQKQAHKSHADFVKAVSAPVPKASKDTGEIVKYRH